MFSPLRDGARLCSDWMGYKKGRSRTTNELQRPQRLALQGRRLSAALVCMETLITAPV
jgi:hypothetical protein